MLQFQGEEYFDDRLFVLGLCKGTVRYARDDEVYWTTIYHGDAPADHVWCVVTYHNRYRYPCFTVNHFDTEAAALAYMRRIEPQTPRISLDGQQLGYKVSYEEYAAWKRANNLGDYDWQKTFPDWPSAISGTQQENIGQTREQYERSMRLSQGLEG